MHYRNGREAKNGDKVIMWHQPTAAMAQGILENAVAGNDYCNGYLWPAGVWVNLRDCLHVEDFAKLWPEDHLGPCIIPTFSKS